MRCCQVVIVSFLLTVAWCAVITTRLASASNISIQMSPMSDPADPAKPTVQEVIASWYGREFAGRLTTSGERFDPYQLTAASVTIPLGSVVKVENPTNGRSVNVRVNDCGPYVRGRSLDLSLGAARRIGISRQGIARLRITPITVTQGADADRCTQ